MFDVLTVFEAAILGTMLAATDAALGKAVITNKSVPAQIREGLNVESGLNDGLCVPILLVFIALALDTHAASSGGASPLRLVAQELGVGALVGVGLACALLMLNSVTLSSALAESGSSSASLRPPASKPAASMLEE